MPSFLPLNVLRTGASLLVLGLCASTAQAQPKPQDIRFAPGSSGAELTGTVKGDAARHYRLVAGAGQTLDVSLKAANGAQYFNIIAPGSNEAMFRGEIGGQSAQVVLPTDGAYVIQTYLMRSAARRNESSAYALKITVTGAALPALPGRQDAKIPGTPYHASAPLPCQPPYGAAPTTCEAGVIRRGRDGTATVEIRGPNQLFRQILFVKGEAAASNTAQAMKSRREGDRSSVEFDGDERYDIPDALLTGG